MQRSAIVYLCISTFVGAFTPALSSDDNQLERGEYLVRTVMACGACHGENLAGGEGFTEFGNTIRPANITPDLETGIGGWSDEAIIHAIRNGQRPDGSFVGIPMPVPSYKHLSDGDVKAIVAYLRTVEPVARKVEPSDYIGDFIPKAYGEDVDSVSAPDMSDPVRRGRYLVHLGHCLECHTPWDQPGLTGAGGNEFQVDDLFLVTANLTPAGPVADYSDRELATVIRTGVRPDGSKVFPFMAFDSYKNLQDEDIKAIVAYLRTLAPAVP